MAELMFFKRKEISPYEYSKPTSEEYHEGWSVKTHNVTILPAYYETDVNANTNGDFDKDDLPTITFNFNLESDDAPNYGRFITDGFKIVKSTDDFFIPYYTEIKVDFFKGNEKIYTYDATTKGRITSNNQETYFCDVRDFNKIVISFIKAPANSTGRFYDLYVDLLYPKVLNNKELTITDFSSFKIKEAINVLSDDMPMGSLECDIVSTSEFNIKKSTLFDVENNGKYYGRFVVVDFKRTGDNVYHLSANSMKSELDDSKYDEWTSQSGHNPLETIYNKTGVGIAFNDLSDYKEYGGYIGVDTCRYALCQYAWAQNVMATDARKSYIELIPVSKAVKHKITNSGEKKKIIGNSTLNETRRFSAANYVIHDYYFYNTDNNEEVVIAELKGTFQLPVTHYFEDAPVIPNIEDMTKARLYQVYGVSSNKVIFQYNGLEYDTEKTLIIKGYKSTKTEKTIPIIPDIRADGGGTKEYDKYTLHVYDAYDEEGNEIIKSPMIKKVLESRGEVKAKIVLDDEQVGDLVDIDTAFEGTIRGIITSMEYTPNYQTIADITILALDIGLEPLYDEDGNPIYDKLDDIILVEGDA